jgi:hypothetical protein
MLKRRSACDQLLISHIKVQFCAPLHLFLVRLTSHQTTAITASFLKNARNELYLGFRFMLLPSWGHAVGQTAASRWEKLRSAIVKKSRADTTFLDLLLEQVWLYNGYLLTALTIAFFGAQVDPLVATSPDRQSMKTGSVAAQTVIENKRRRSLNAQVTQPNSGPNDQHTKVVRNAHIARQSQSVQATGAYTTLTAHEAAALCLKVALSHQRTTTEQRSFLIINTDLFDSQNLTTNNAELLQKRVGLDMIQTFIKLLKSCGPVVRNARPKWHPADFLVSKVMYLEFLEGLASCQGKPFVWNQVSRSDTSIPETDRMEPGAPAGGTLPAASYGRNTVAWQQNTRSFFHKCAARAERKGGVSFF